MKSEPVVSGLGRGAAGATSRAKPAPVIGTFALVLLALATPLAHGYSTAGEPKAAPVEELKLMYLECSRAAVGGRMSSGAIMQCSIVYEELKRRAFGGDFERLLAWSRAQPLVRTSGRRIGAHEAAPGR